MKVIWGGCLSETGIGVPEKSKEKKQISLYAYVLDAMYQTLYDIFIIPLSPYTS